MSYLTQSHIASNGSMMDRLAQAAASEGFGEPDSWASNNRRVWAASPGWDAAWESSLASHPDDPTYDPGADEAVITDGMILSAVQEIGEPV
jgi:hypothetical protein